MTPSVQNLNSKLPALGEGSRRRGGAGPGRRAPAAHLSSGSVRIAGARSSYRGGYHLSGR